MKRYFAGLAALALAVVAALSVMGTTPNSKLKMGHDYRYIWSGASSNSVARRIVFPRIGSTFAGDDLTLPDTTGDADAQKWLKTQIRHARWVHIAQVENGGGPESFVIFSPLGMAIDGDGKNVDTVMVSNDVRTYTFGGCQIDSVIMPIATINGVDHEILVTD